MKILNTLLLLSFSFIQVTPSLLSIAKLVFEWKTDLGSQVPGITPLFAKLGDGIALASIVQDNEKNFHLNVTSLSETGNRRASCEVPLLPLADVVSNTRMTYLGESRVGVTWLLNDKQKSESGLRLTVVYLDNCLFSTVTITVDRDVDYVYHVPYAVVPYEGGKFDVFVKSPTVCGHGVCKIGFKTDGQQIVKNGKPISCMNDDDFLGWTIVPVEPYTPSTGFYLFGLTKNNQDTSTSTSTIKKFGPDCTVLNSVERKQTGEEVTGYSNAYGNFGFCSTTPVGKTVSCSLFDTNLTKKLQVSVPVDLPVRKIGLGNDNNGGFLLLLNSCLNEHCFDHVTVARKIDAKGKDHGPEEFTRSRAGCYPRNSYDVFVDEEENVYCTGAPCMRKTANSTAYDVSAHIKCLKNL